ncbi:leucine-rich repeat flightless-interacting protein 1 isoform X14 [Mauremys mutica]|uniref:leucine-rich repeat flightless-interacting protein 1 isoform X14 n=1 Tax=Mauremys mutica TaxID=74926 RepID=UPI001D1479A8|nr:leucine-rich repeat flightless-interacting protein 1 isoform X14 [Mauremys mutica]
MGTQGAGRKRLPNRERLTAEDDALNQIAREAEARLAAKRAARAEAREIRMKELERQQKEIYQVQKKYYGLDTKWGDIEQWMEDSERYSRRSRRNASASDEDERMSVGSRGSLRVEERPEKDFEKGVRTVSSLSAATLASLGGTSSRRGSGDTSISVDTEASIREIKDINELKNQIQDVEGKYMQGLKEMKDSLAEVEEKYKKAMVSNAQLDNEKTNFMYQVDTLKDALLELEEQLAESRRQYEEKSKEFEREKHAHSILQFQFTEIKETLKQREEMLEEIRQLQQKQESYIREISDLQETIEWKDKKIGALERQKEFFDSIRSERDDLRDEVVVLKEQLKKHGIIPNLEVAINGEALDGFDNEAHSDSTKITPGATQILQTAGDGTLDRLKKLIGERESLLEQIKILKGQLEEKQKNDKMENLQSEDEVLENGTDMHMIDLQRDANRQISDLKFKLAKSEQEITTLEQNVIRLEGQVARYKCAAENAEKIEDELKAEKRKLQRELRSALDKTEELEVSNGHLVKRLEKMKANRSALLSQQ